MIFHYGAHRMIRFADIIPDYFIVPLNLIDLKNGTLYFDLEDLIIQRMK